MLNSYRWLVIIWDIRCQVDDLGCTAVGLADRMFPFGLGLSNGGVGVEACGPERTERTCINVKTMTTLRITTLLIANKYVLFIGLASFGVMLAAMNSMTPFKSLFNHQKVTMNRQKTPLHYGEEE